MAKMKNYTVDFYNDFEKLVTQEPVLLSWASVNLPDTDNLNYSVEMKWNKDDQWVKDLIKIATDFENERRAHYGLDAVDIASIFLTDGGQPRISECGQFYTPRASGKTNDAEYTTDSGKVVPVYGKNKPRVFNVHAQPDSDLTIWTGDECKVAFILGFYNSGGNYGTKFYLKDVQQIVAGPGPTNSNPFGDESDGSPSDDVPF